MLHQTLLHCCFNVNTQLRHFSLSADSDSAHLSHVGHDAVDVQHK